MAGDNQFIFGSADRRLFFFFSFFSLLFVPLDCRTSVGLIASFAVGSRTIDGLIFLVVLNIYQRVVSAGFIAGFDADHSVTQRMPGSKRGFFRKQHVLVTRRQSYRESS